MKRILSLVAWICFPASMAFAQQTFYFPQVADGRDPGGTTHWHTTIFLSNQSGSVASGTVTMYQSGGSAMNISFVDDLGAGAAVANRITFQIPAGQTRKYTSVASGELAVGYAVVTADVPIAGNAMFAHWSNPPGESLLAEAGVPSASLLSKQAVFVDTQFGFNTGVAIANPGTSSASFTLDLISRDGQVVASTTQTLGPGQHIARFTTEMFGPFAAMAGRLQISSSTPVAAMALRFDSRLEKFTTMFPFTVP
jgi:hypothetical protein